MIALPTATTSFQLARFISRFDDYKLSKSAVHCLCVIDAAGADSLTMTSAARAMRISTAAITSIADHLEERGFIARRTARVDSRVIWLDLTERGKDALQDILTTA